MANSSAGFGFLPFGRREGGAPTAGHTRLFVASSDTNAVFTGDVVQDSTTSGPYVTLATTGTVAVRGIFVGNEFFNPTIGFVRWQRFFPGSVQTSSGTADATGYVIDDPEQLFIARGSTSGTITSSQVGLNIGFMSSMGGNTLDGGSRAVLASSTISAKRSLPFRIFGLYSNFAPPGAEGTDNASVNNIVVVAPNNWSRKQLTARST